MSLVNYTWLDQSQIVLAAFILLTAFLLLVEKRVNALANTFMAQSFFLTLTTVAEAVQLNHIGLYIAAGITLLVKVITVPLFLRYMARRLGIEQKATSVTSPFLLMLTAIFLVLFCYHLVVAQPVAALLPISNVLAVAMALILIGMLMLISHYRVMAHIIGFMMIENGIFFGALVASHGLPMIVEFGVAFDVLVAVVLFGVLFLHINDRIDSLEVDRLNLLREDLQ